MSVLSATGKRSYLRAPERRAQIMNIAKHIFARRGYHRASIADICQAARIGRGTLYQYFRNKEQVLVALLEDVAERVESVVAARLRVADLKVDSPDARAIVAFCERRLRQVLDAVFVDEATLRLVFRQARGVDGVIQRTLARIDRLVLGAVEADLEHARRLGLLGPGDLRLAARHFIGGLEKVLILALTNNEPIDLDVLVRETVKLQLFGILGGAS